MAEVLTPEALQNVIQRDNILFKKAQSLFSALEKLAQNQNSVIPQSLRFYYEQLVKDFPKVTEKLDANNEVLLLANFLDYDELANKFAVLAKLLS